MRRGRDEEGAEAEESVMAEVKRRRDVPDAVRNARTGSGVGVCDGVSKSQILSLSLSRLEMKNALGIHQVVFIRMLYFLGSNGSCPAHLAGDRQSLILLIEP